MDVNEVSTKSKSQMVRVLLESCVKKQVLTRAIPRDTSSKLTLSLKSHKRARGIPVDGISLAIR